MEEWKKYKLGEISWSNWKQFPNPRKKEELIAPFGFGIYQLRNIKTKQFILFGKGKNTAYRMSSLLPAPLGPRGRNNQNKRIYVLKHIQNIEYRTFACATQEEMNALEKDIKTQENYIYKT